MRQATVVRQTGETSINLTLHIDGSGQADIQTGIGFLDHMLTLLAGHGLFDLSVAAQGDIHIDEHHTAEVYLSGQSTGPSFGRPSRYCAYGAQLCNHGRNAGPSGLGPERAAILRI